MATPEERKAERKAARIAARQVDKDQARGQRIAQRKADRVNTAKLKRLQDRDTANGKAPKDDLAAYGRPTSSWFDMTDNGSIAGIDLLPPAGTGIA